ncbi:MAG: hypothetical protein SCH71_08290 [Desulfobulbaceae bacterium]|nr:hypothetical protein [Desulfobulbaceae bacterium]
MTMASILWIIIIGAVFYLLMKNGGGCCGSHHHGKNEGHDGNGGSDGRERDSEHHGMKIEEQQIWRKQIRFAACKSMVIRFPADTGGKPFTSVPRDAERFSL